MLSEFKYKPQHAEPSDLPTIAKRYSLGIRTMDRVHEISSANIVKVATKQEQEGVCYDYALKQTTGYFDPRIKCYGRNVLPDPEKFFEQTLHPQKNDLVIYTTSESIRATPHFAIFINKNTFESKWGTHTEIMQHKPFDVPDYYGNAISFWTLKEEWKKPENKQALIQAMESDVDNRIGRNLFIFPITLGICLGSIVAGIWDHI